MGILVSVSLDHHSAYSHFRKRNGGAMKYNGVYPLPLFEGFPGYLYLGTMGNPINVPFYYCVIAMKTALELYWVLGRRGRESG